MEHPLIKEGVLRTKATLARAGIQKYPIKDRWENVLRREDIVSNSVLTDTLPITVEHPSAFIGGDMQSPLVVGLAKNIRYRDGLIIADLEITDESAIAKVLDTHKYVSLGYRANLLQEDGVWTDDLGLHGHIGEKYAYAYRQEDIKLDHAALVSKPRAGAIASLQLDETETNQTKERIDSVMFTDSVESAIIQSDIVTIDKNMIKQFLFGDSVLAIDGENASDIVSALNSQKEEIKTFTDALAVKTSELESVNGQLEASKVKLTELNDSIKTLEANLEAAKAEKLEDSEVADRIAIWQEVQPILAKDNAEFKPNYALSVAAVKAEYLKVKAPHLSEKLKDASEAFIDGLWEGLQPKNQTNQKDTFKDALGRSEITLDVTTKQINRNRPLPGANA